MMEVEVSQLVFYLLSFVIIISAIYVVTLRNIFHSALFLILTLFAVAGIYIMLNAEFLAAVQVLIYVGAISILIIFAIMLTSQLANKQIRQSNEQVMIGIFICSGFLLASLGSIANTVWRIVEKPLPENNTLTMGKLLMNEFVLPFEIVSIVLLAALIGAVVLARKEGA
jgi:NADH-quinone oxidoreductase subunit J